MRVSWAAACLALLALLPGARTLAQVHAYGLAARVNGVGISNATLESNFEEYLRDQQVNVAAIRNPDRLKALRRETLDLLVDQELLWQAAQKAGVVATPAEVDAELQQVQAQFHSADAMRTRLAIEGYTEDSYRAHVERLVSARKYRDGLAAGVTVDDAEVHTFYVEHPEKFQVPEVVRARHILVRVDAAADAKTRRAAREKLEDIRSQVLAGSEFAALARQYSQDSSAARGGDLGYFPHGHMVESFEAAAFSLPVGQVSEIVESPFGLHLILVEDHREAHSLSEDQVRKRLRDLLAADKRKQASDERLQALREAAQIELLLPL